MAYKPPTQTVIDNDTKNYPSNEAVFEQLKTKANQFPLAQTPITLTDAATISTDASLGNIFRVTLGGNRTLGNPSNATDGQMLHFEIKQDGSGGRTLAFDTKFRFSSDLTQPSLSSGANKLDRILFIYRSADDKFDCLAVNKGF